MLRSKWVVLVGVVWLAACSPEPPPDRSVAPMPVVPELVKTDVAVGSGAAIAKGQTAVVHYTGWLYAPGAPEDKGVQFDSSRDSGRPFRFKVGAGRVIEGWDEGVAGMMVGGRRILLVPADMGYGKSGAGRVIPPGAPLLFDVELLAIEN
ncbi:FKBP-type peptidyl-prolyl cis-trans isomerase [Povalibacter sp.]|uniref:FKBP-type peptidyl-prolyl cis-trans isomerase n=1 Tax=Povalibacter sp. TaxID=1962978 RepID=UPI002F3FA960